MCEYLYFLISIYANASTKEAVKEVEIVNEDDKWFQQKPDIQLLHH